MFGSGGVAGSHGCLQEHDARWRMQHLLQLGLFFSRYTAREEALKNPTLD